MAYGRCHGLALRLFRDRYLTCAHLYTLLREYQRSADIKRNKKGKQMLFENLNLNAYYYITITFSFYYSSRYIKINKDDMKRKCVFLTCSRVGDSAVVVLDTI